MRVVLSWLREFAPFGDDVDELATAMTALGMEVSGVERVAEPVPGLVVARVVETRRHPQAERVIVSVPGPIGRGRDQRVRVRRMEELTAAPVSRPCRRRLETVRRPANRHLSRSLRDEQPCPCPSPAILDGNCRLASHRSAVVGSPTCVQMDA